MNIEEFLAQGLTLVGTFNFKIAVFLFLLCFISEGIGLSIPYLLETTWLLAGYQLSRGILPFPHLILLILTAQAGRQTGSLIMYHIGRVGSIPLAKPLRRFLEYLKLKTSVDNALSSDAFRKINLLSPFSVALGRLFWLRIPLTLILGAKRMRRVLMLGILIQSLIWDSAYVILGSIVGTAVILKPLEAFLIFLAGITLTYVVTFLVRRFIKFVRAT